MVLGLGFGCLFGWFAFGLVVIGWVVWVCFVLLSVVFAVFGSVVCLVVVWTWFCDLFGFSCCWWCLGLL